MVVQGKESTRSIVNFLSLDVHFTTVYHILRDNPIIRCQKLKAAPHVTAKLKMARLDFTQNNMGTDFHNYSIYTVLMNFKCGYRNATDCIIYSVYTRSRDTYR